MYGKYLAFSCEVFNFSVVLRSLWQVTALRELCDKEAVVEGKSFPCKNLFLITVW